MPLRYLAIGLSVISAFLTALVLSKHVATVSSLRGFGERDYPLIEPLILLPSLGILAAVMLIWRRENFAAAVIAGLSAGISGLFWIVQAASQMG